ncbi:MAG: OmpA family protein [Spirochaetales bacterium]|nr:OmpA family protein [Spirochaetales bacterium]
MKSSVLIEIEHTKYMKLIDLEEQTASTALITTVKEDQRRAIIKLIGKKEGAGTTVLGEYEINIPHEYQDGTRRPKIEISARLEGRLLYVKGVLDGRTLFSDTLKAGALLPLPRWIPVSGYILGAAAALALVIWLLSLLAAPAAGGSPSGAAVARNTPQKTAAPAATVRPAPTAAPTETAAASIVEPAAAPTQKPAEEPLPAVPSYTIALTVYFEPNDSSLSAEAKEELTSILDELKTYTDARVRIWGHCAIKGTEEGREQLSEERARNVKDYLSLQGYSGGRVDLKWFAGTRPVTTEEEEQHLNRRVEIAILAE